MEFRPTFGLPKPQSGVAPEAFEALQQLIQLENETQIEQTDFSEQFLDVTVEGRIDPVHFYGESDFLSILTDRKSHRFPDAQSGTERQHIVWAAGETSLRLPFHLRDGKLIDTTLAKPGVQRNRSLAASLRRTHGIRGASLGGQDPAGSGIDNVSLLQRKPVDELLEQSSGTKAPRCCRASYYSFG